jgi:ATP-dependent helicase/nuclease subunit A
MESPLKDKNPLTDMQRQAVIARGNVLVMAGAGTGKTHTLVERCLHCLCAEQPPASLEEILVVTFTEAAAAEMRQRLRERLEQALDSRPPGAPKQSEGGSILDQHWAEQIALFDAAHIGTLHSFCLKLVREHFHELGLDPQLAVLDAGQARLLADETLEEELQAHYSGPDDLAVAVQKLIQIYGGSRDQAIRRLVLRLHNYAQTRPDASGWLSRQVERFADPVPGEWRNWLLDALQRWREEWLPDLERPGTPANVKAAELAEILRRLPDNFSRDQAAEILAQIVSADTSWPTGKKTVLRQPLEDLFDDANFLASLAAVKNGDDPLAEDWAWVRGHMKALLQLTRNFSTRFAARKREDGVLDFHDLEQFALKLLWDFAADKPTPTADQWRRKIRFVFVDEYQDINAAQDKIIQALSRDFFPSPRPSGERAGARGAEFETKNLLPPPRSVGGGKGEELLPHHGNRFLVGDVKQSIYRFRLADPEIFRGYARSWRGQNGQTIHLAENFRSRESLVLFVNSVFELLLREEAGGVRYDAEARLRFGAPEQRAQLGAANDPAPRAELLLRFKSSRSEAESGDETDVDDLADLLETEKEARLLGQRLQQLKTGKYEIWDAVKKGFHPAEWRDMAVLLRAPSGKAEVYAKEFQLAGVPLVVERGGFYDRSEILDLLSLLQLLDNPLQDVPAIAVLRSPLVGLSLDDLAQIRLAARMARFWTALNRWREAAAQEERAGGKTKTDAFSKVDRFLNNFSRWRKLTRQASLSQCLETVLTETFYADWLATRPRGAQQQANVERFLGLAQKFDQFQRQGLFRFLKFIEAQREAEVEPEVAPAADENAVRLMSIHQSKGLGFPIVAVADLAKPFNTRDLREEIIVDERYGLAPRVKPPHTGRRYPSLPHWLAQRHQRREQWGEELRLLYVALTRARDMLILTGTVAERKWESLWTSPEPVTTRAIIAAKSFADWLGLWFAAKVGGTDMRRGERPHWCWRILDDVELHDDSTRGSRGSPRQSEATVGDEAQSKDQPATPHAGSGKDTIGLDAATAEKLQAVLSWKYPFAAATQRAGKSSVTALRRQATDELDDEADPLFEHRLFTKRPLPPAAPPDPRPKLSAAEAGTAHHKFLQRVALDKVCDVVTLRAEAIRLEQEKFLTAEERAALVLGNIAAFWLSEPGRKIRAQAAGVRRELAFTARFSPAELAALTGAESAPELETEFVVVQGVADLVVLLADEIWLADFKTDEIRQAGLPDKIKAYTPQLRLYARALEKIYARPVKERWLHFLSARKTVNVEAGPERADAESV